MRCLPNSFPTYAYTRSGPVSPQYFAVTRNDLRYAIIFNNHGVPIWWVHTLTWNARVLPSGDVLWFNPPPGQFEIHRLNGGLVRVLRPVGLPSDGHDLRFASNGDHLVASGILQDHVDTSAYGGSSDATVKQAELQEVSPSGQLVWDWKTQDHISLAETGRWWPSAVGFGYDLVHWNSIQPAGNGSVIASFRHLDAVYKIDKSTGAIVWKLGGTSRPESLSVIGDPRPYTFGGQHDARLLGDGTVTVFDNRTDLNSRPRAVRFRIDETRRDRHAPAVDQRPGRPALRLLRLGTAPQQRGLADRLGQATNHPIGGYEANGDRERSC